MDLWTASTKTATLLMTRINHCNREECARPRRESDKEGPGLGYSFAGCWRGGVMKDLCEMQQETGLKKRMRVHALVKNAVSG